MFKRKLLKQSKIRRLLLRLFNMHAIDKETFNLIHPLLNNKGKNHYILNDKSYILSNGYLELTRKIRNIDIFYRYCPNVDLWNSNGSWKRIIPNVDKKKLIKTSLLSLKKSILNFLKENSINIKINLISDNSNNSFDSELRKLIENKDYEVEFYKSKVLGNKGSFLECCDQAEKAKDLIFFVEDDYLFKENCLDELVFSFTRVSSLIKEDVFLCPSDYPFYYDSNYSTSLFIGKNYKWRIVKETLLTILFSKSLFDEHKSNIRLVGEKQNEPFEKPLHEIFELKPCLAPIGSISHHLSRTIPSIEPDWIELWETIYDEVK